MVDHAGSAEAFVNLLARGVYVADTYELMFLPSIQPDSYVLVTSRGLSAAVRHYPYPKGPPPKPSHGRDRGDLLAEARRAGLPIEPKEPLATDKVNQWWIRIRGANRRHLGP